MNAKLEVLEKRIADVEERLSTLEEMIENASPTDKGYTELVNAYNKWADVYTRLVDDLERLDYDEYEKVKEKRIDLILRCVELGCKAFGTVIPLIAIFGTIGIAKLSYTQDQQLVLRNGNVMGNAKDLMQLVKMKVN